MEYLFVEFDDDRRLVIDNAPTAWRTNETVPIQAGSHVVSLVTPPANFTPPEIAVVMAWTSVDNPKTIKFTKIAVTTTTVAPRVASPPSTSGKP